jgi:hypothetical protein
MFRGTKAHKEYFQQIFNLQNEESPEASRAACLECLEQLCVFAHSNNLNMGDILSRAEEFKLSITPVAPPVTLFAFQEAVCAKWGKKDWKNPSKTLATLKEKLECVRMGFKSDETLCEAMAFLATYSNTIGFVWDEVEPQGGAQENTGTEAAAAASSD